MIKRSWTTSRPQCFQATSRRLQTWTGSRRSAWCRRGRRTRRRWSRWRSTSSWLRRWGIAWWRRSALAMRLRRGLRRRVPGIKKHFVNHTSICVKKVRFSYHLRQTWRLMRQLTTYMSISWNLCPKVRLMGQPSDISVIQLGLCVNQIDICVK